MSLHIDISDTAQRALIRQKRLSIFSAFLSATLILALVSIIFLLTKILLPVDSKTPSIVYSEPFSPDPDPVIERIADSQPTSTPTPTNRIITADSANIDVSIPTVPITDSDNYQPTPITTGDPIGQTSGATGVPDTMKKRCSLEDRLERIKKSGGSVKYEEAVVAGLRWLQSKQNPDGSWTGAGFPASMTGLSLLAYLAHCETPYSHDFGESCQNAITYLVNLSKKNNGYLTTLPLTDKRIAYDHAIATYALAEAHTFCQSIGVPIEGLGEAVEKAGQIILKSQARDGGWMYAYRTEAVDGSHPDLSVTGWNIQAVKALGYSPSKNKLDTERSLKRASQFVRKMCDIRTGEFYYSGPETPKPTMTPVGVLSLQMMRLAHSKEAREGLNSLAKTVETVDLSNAYFYYYAAQALMNRNGPTWDKYGKNLGNLLVSKQEKDGSWKDDPVTPLGPASGNPDPFYKTALSILTLEVYYRFLPGTGEGTLDTTSGEE